MTETLADAICHAANLHELGLGREGELCHLCLGLDLKRLSLAKEMRLAGLVFIEDSANGPMVTRTHRGTLMLKRAGRAALAQEEERAG